MNSTQRELLRLSVLRVLHANRTRHGLMPTVIGAHVRAVYGFPDVTDEEMQSALEYLESKGFVFNPPRIISPENVTWAITDAGDVELKKHG